MPYGYKQPGNWKTLRRSVLARDENRCYICGDTATEVDALTPESQGGSHADPDNLAAICELHHRQKSDDERRAGQAKRKATMSRTRQPEAHPGMRA